MLIKPLLLSTAHPGFAASPAALRNGAAALAHVIEFHAEAGAPEGALYVDGQLVGHLPGVCRL